jgi:predicted transcriptional regulator
MPLSGVAKRGYREKYELIATILSSIKGSGIEGATKTSIMYKSFLSHAQLKEYVSFLVEKGLVDAHQQVKNGNVKLVFKITDKGSRVLQIASYQNENIIELNKVSNND